MVFMGADGVEGNTPLSHEAQKDIEEMEKVHPEDSGGALNIFVQLHGDGVPVRYHVGIEGCKAVPEKEQDLTNGKALASFLGWSLKKAAEAGIEGDLEDHYSILVLWGHAYRFGIGHTETRAGIDALDFAELATVLRDFQEGLKNTYGMKETPKLDIVGFDACDLATIEMSVQLSQFARYLLASQIGIPLPGWPYHRILDRLKNPYGRIMGPAEFGTYVVRRFCEEYHAEERTVSLTLLDLERAPELFALTELLAMRLAIALNQDPDQQELVFDLFCRSQTDDDKPFIDVADLCLNLVRDSNDPFVQQAAEGLGDLLISPPPVAPGGSAVGARRPFIVEHARNTGKAARLHGVSLYAPHVASSHRWEEASHWYKKFVFAQNTLWSGLVHALAQPS